MRKLSASVALLLCALAAPAQAQWLQVPQVDGLRLNDRVATSPCSVGQACLFRYGLTLQYQRTDGVVTTIGPVTLQQAYNNGGVGPSLLTEDATRLGIIIRQDVGATSDPVFAVQTNSGGTDLLNVNGSRVRIGKPILMDAIGGNTITMSQSGIYSGNGPPTFTTVSTGEKLSLVSRIDGANTNLAIGVDATGGNGMWFGTSRNNSADTFKFYGGITEVFRIGGTGLTFVPAGGGLDTLTGGTLVLGTTNMITGQVGGAATTSINLVISGSTRFQVASTGSLLPGADNTYNIGSSTQRLANLLTFAVNSGVAAAAVDTVGSTLTISTQPGGNSSAAAAGNGGPLNVIPAAGGTASAAGAAGTGGAGTYSSGGGGSGVNGSNGTAGGNGIAGGASGLTTISTGNAATAGAGGTGTSGAGGNGAAGAAAGGVSINGGVSAAGGAGGATTGGGAGGAGGAGGVGPLLGMGTGSTVRPGAGGVGGNTSTGGNAGAGGLGGSGGGFFIGTGNAGQGANGGNGGTASGGGSNGAGGNGGVGSVITLGGASALQGGAGGQAGGAGATGGSGGGGGAITNTAGSGGAGGAANGGTQGNGGGGGAYTSSAGAGGSGLTGGSGGNWSANSGAGGAGGNTNSGDIILNVAAAGGAGTAGAIRFQAAGATITAFNPSTATWTSSTAGNVNIGSSTNYFGTIYSRHFHGAGTAPTIAVGNAAQLGTGPAAAVTAGSDAGATVTLTTGTGPTAFVAATEVKLGTVSFNTTYAIAAPRAIVVTPAAALSGALSTGANGISCYAKQSTTTTGQFDIFCVSSGTPTLAASTAYPYALVVIQ